MWNEQRRSNVNSEAPFQRQRKFMQPM